MVSFTREESGSTVIDENVCFLSLYVQQLLGLPISLEDISSVDPELYSSLKWIM